MKYRRRPPEIEATRWFKNGDHPQDGPAFEHGDAREGKVVRYFRDPTIDGQVHCELCGSQFHDHGWIDSGRRGHTVCPGDWIVPVTSELSVRGVEGDLYPMRDEVFRATYEEVSDAVPTEGDASPGKEDGPVGDAENPQDDEGCGGAPQGRPDGGA